MLVLQFKNDKACLQERRFSQKHRLLKSKNRQYLSLATKKDKSKTNFKVPENKVPLLFASRPRYKQFMLFTSLNAWLKYLLRNITETWAYHF